jgi:hypothetical protein
MAERLHLVDGSVRPRGRPSAGPRDQSTVDAARPERMPVASAVRPLPSTRRRKASKVSARLTSTRPVLAPRPISASCARRRAP